MISPIDLPDRKDPSFPDALKNLRIKFGITRKELADLAEISRGMPLRYEEVNCAYHLPPKQSSLDKIIAAFKKLNKEDDDRLAYELELMNRAPIRYVQGPIRTIWQPGSKPKNAIF